jgi:hypothetical protein
MVTLLNRVQFFHVHAIIWRWRAGCRTIIPWCHSVTHFLIPYSVPEISETRSSREYRQIQAELNEFSKGHDGKTNPETEDTANIREITAGLKS